MSSDGMMSSIETFEWPKQSHNYTLYYIFAEKKHIFLFHSMQLPLVFVFFWSAKKMRPIVKQIWNIANNLIRFCDNVSHVLINKSNIAFPISDALCSKHEERRAQINCSVSALNSKRAQVKYFRNYFLKFWYPERMIRYTPITRLVQIYYASHAARLLQYPNVIQHTR